MPPQTPAPKSAPSAAGARRPVARPAAGSASKPGAAAAKAASKVALPRVGKVKTGDYKASVGSRVGAVAVDGVIGLGLGCMVYFQLGIWVSTLLLVAYLLIRDGLPISGLGYTSIGKKVLGLQVEVEATGVSRIDPGKSVVRNLTLVAGLLPLPVLWSISMPLALAVAAVPPAVEMAMVISNKNGIRLGDRMAGTKVLD